MEKLLYCRLISFLCKNNYCFSNQFGFRKLYSTEHALQFMVTTVNDGLDGHMKVATLFLDILKAFDTVDHQILLGKLRNCGVRGNVIKLFESYLADRSIFMEVGGIASSRYPIQCGAPQGSPLGPLLFAIYIKDLCNAVSGLTNDLSSDFRGPKKVLVLFADDTNLTIIARTEQELVGLLEGDLHNIERWMTLNKLAINSN